MSQEQTFLEQPRPLAVPALPTLPTLTPETAPTLAGSLTSRAPRSLWSNAWRQFRRNKLAVAGAIYLLFLVVVAAAAPLIAPHNPVQGDLREAGKYRQAAWIETDNPKTTGSWDHPLGTDSNGRDVFSRLVYGTRISLVVGFIPMLIVMAVGIPIGLLAGYSGGRLDNILMRLTDVVYAFPALLFFIIMQISLGETWFGELLNGLVLLFVTLSVISWTGVARLVRGETISLKEKEYVEAARASGAAGSKLVTRHILPNALGPVIVAGAFIVPGAIIAEAVLSYLGIGLRPSADLNNPFPTSWGQMIQAGQTAFRNQAWLLIAPSIAVGLITLAFTFVGDGLRDALDPRDQV